MASCSRARGGTVPSTKHNFPEKVVALRLMRSWPTLLLAVALAGCPPRKPVDVTPASSSSCGGLSNRECGRAQGLLAAATGFGNVRHEYLLDAASSLAPGRGVEKTASGAYAILPTKCAEQKESGGNVDASTVDFTYVGVALDRRLISADTDLVPFVSAGAAAEEHVVSLVAIAFVRDLDPQFFAASTDVQFGGSACRCGRATHFVGAVKTGGLLSYEMRIRSAELHGRALEFVQARLATSDVTVTQTQAGGLQVDGLDAAMRGDASAKPLSFRVKTPVPIAYAIYPLGDVCKFAFPAPEVSPPLVEFGDVPYGREEKRLLHVVNRASIDLRASLGDRTFAVPALGTADVQISWTPEGQTLGCETQTREETLQFYPRDGEAPVIPQTQSVKVTARVRTGKPSFRRHEHIDTGVHRAPDYASTARDFTCPSDYALTSCRTEKAMCGDGACQTDGYAVNAENTENGCRFSCRGPNGLLPGISANYCRFDAVMECRLRCR